MEYTKDLILNICYNDVKHIKKKDKHLLRRLLEKIRKHKIVATSILLGMALIMVDCILICNFVYILENWSL